MSLPFDLKDHGTVYQEVDPGHCPPLPPEEAKSMDFLDLCYRTLCAVMFNHASSGHPGGSVSSGRIVQSLVFNRMDYDIGNPMDRTADILSYAAGHKALGLYALSALRNEVVRLVAPDQLPVDVKQQMRLEDILGFRKNPITSTPLFREFGAKPLDGHPTPETPFVWLSTGPSGVGVATSVGLAMTLKDMHREHAPAVHVIEGEGGMTPGRVAEALAAPPGGVVRATTYGSDRTRRLLIATEMIGAARRNSGVVSAEISLRDLFAASPSAAGIGASAALVDMASSTIIAGARTDAVISGSDIEGTRPLGNLRVRVNGIVTGHEGTADALAELDAGVGLVVHVGHGYRNTLSMGTGTLSNGDIDALAVSHDEGIDRKSVV